MRFCTQSLAHYCGIDLHAKTMYLCILDREGETVLGHALYMKAIHGGKAKNDKVDAFKIASLLRGGNLPKVYVYPPEMRATRDLLRRRLHLVRRRGNLLAHIQNTHHQYNLEVPMKKVAYKANRAGVAEAFEDGDVQKSLEVDLDRVGRYDEVLKDLQLHLEHRAKEHDGDAYYRLRSVPGIGKILALMILYEIHDIARFERVQDFLSYSRLVKCEHSSGGKRLGTGGAKIGNVQLKWAFSEAAALFLRNNPRGQQLDADSCVDPPGVSLQRLLGLFVEPHAGPRRLTDRS